MSQYKNPHKSAVPWGLWALVIVMLAVVFWNVYQMAEH
jgi:hypothetical protein